MRKKRLKLYSRKALYRIAFGLVVLGGAAAWGFAMMTKMPGRSFSGPLPALTEKESVLAARLRAHVEALAGRIGTRDFISPAKLADAERYVAEQFALSGRSAERQSYHIDWKEIGVLGLECHNLVVEIRGASRPEEIVIVGGHYDSCGNPGANDNASGVAATLELARLFALKQPARTLRFAAFVNEEPPFFKTRFMGSLVYARACRERNDDVVAMLSLETIGYYSDEAGSQRYPFPFSLAYPSTGNFIAFVGNFGSRALVRHAVGAFRAGCEFPSEGGAIPSMVEGVGWSDHWSFWQAGYRALMVTDTAPFRYPHYHQLSDTPEKLDYERLARVVAGLEKVIEDLAGTEKRFD
jgi:hypothetical protein